MAVPLRSENDTYGLRRFEVAQDHAGTYETALGELRAGRKVSHWMWFIFPQISGLGHSSTARTYAISSLAEAEAYLADPVLGPRLIQSTCALGLSGRTAQEIFGDTDAMKLRSSMTLFARAAPEIELFQEVLNGYFGGVNDEMTETRLEYLSRSHHSVDAGA